MPPVIELAHVSLLVADTERALRFYRDILGLAVNPARPELGYPGAWLDLGHQQLHLLELPNPDPTTDRPAHGGRDRHTAVYTDDIEAIKQALARADIPFTLSKSGRAALFCRDPDGNAWEFIAHAR